MIIKKYIVNSMNEAMTRIRYELGKDAIIISQRKIRRPGLKGFFSKKVIEVTAAIENNQNNKDTVQDSIETIKNIIAKDNNIKYNSNKWTEAKQSVDNKEKLVADLDLVKEMQEMKSMISNMATTNSSVVKEKDETYLKLESNDVEEELIEEIVSSIDKQNGNLDEIDQIKLWIQNNVNISDDSTLTGKIVLVGPTGVGKTTTIAKLAGRMALIESKSVGLITVDTYRIGAVEQLRTYAEIMNIPFEVVITQKEMEIALEKMKDRDVVLIDTTGRSSKNVMQISELRTFIDKVDTENIHLVLSCTTKNKDIKPIIEGYKVLNYKNIIITKLDETSTYGSILNILNYANKPLSLVTTGQNVPDDLKKLSVSEISNLVLGEDSIC